MKNTRTKRIVKYTKHTNSKQYNIKKSINMKNLNLKVLSAFLFIIVVFTSFLFTFNVEGNTNNNKIYTSIQIEEGDSLWSIAKDYYTDDFSDYNELIDEIKSINNMKDDNIKTGCYIIVPHYIHD